MRKTTKNAFLFLALALFLTACGEKIQELANNDNTVPLAVTDSATTTSNTPVSIDVSLNDNDDANNLDPSSVSIGGSVGGICQFDPAAPVIQFTPNVGFAGLGNCVYSICDEAGNCGNGLFEVLVVDTQLPLLLDDFVSTNLNTNSTPLDVSLNDADAEGPLDIGSLTILASPAPVGGSCIVSPSAPLVVFQPALDFAGIGSCSYQLCDLADSPNCSTAQLQVEVRDTRAPNAVNDTQTMLTTDPSISFDPSINDSDPGVGLDPSSLTISFSVGGQCQSVSPPQVTFSADPGFSGVASCGYRICDLQNNCDTAVISITVQDATAPNASTDSINTNTGQSSTPTNVASNDSDPQNNLDLSSVSILANPIPVGGSCAVTTSPNVVFTPNAGFSGLGSCTYQICDTFGNCSSGTLEVNVLDVGFPVANNDSVSLNASVGSVSVDVSANDTDAQGNLDSSSVNVIFSVGGSCTLNPAAPNIQFVPDTAFSGLGTCGYRICDTVDNCSTAVLEITVVDDVAPLPQEDFATTVVDAASGPINVAVNDSDIHNNLDVSSVTVLAAPAPVGGSCAVITSPNVEFTPSAGFSGAGSCTYQICDTGSNCASAVLNVTVSDNEGPVAVNDSLTIGSDGSSASIDVSSNDNDPQGNLDTASVTVTFSVGGTCAVASPNITFTPNPRFSGSASCGYSICDTLNNCNNALLEVTVNDTVAPNTANDIVNTIAGQASAPINVALNDSDPESNLDVTSVAILAIPAPVGGTCAVTSSPEVVFTPSPGFNGSGSCTYQICDTANNCASATISAIISDQTAPVAQDDLANTTTMTGAVVTDVSANDSDAQGNLDTNSVIVTFSVGGDCAVVSPNITFTPDVGFNGLGSCGYRICDTSDNCSTARLNVTVTDDTPPVAADDDISTVSGQASEGVNVATNDSDLERNLDISTVTVLAMPVPVGGTCAVTTSPNIVFTPNAGFNGLGSCTYQICDTEGNCDSATLNITVNDGSAPVAVDDTTSTTTGSGAVTIDVSANDNDAQGNLDTSSVTISFSLGGSCAVASPNVTFTPDPGFSGTGRCGYNICDTANNCSGAVIIVTVTDNTPPTVQEDFISTQADQISNPVNVALNDSDPENNLNTSSVSILTMPAPVGGTCSVTTSPNVIFTPTAGFSGSGSCTYQICDTLNNCASETINISVSDSASPVALDDTATTDSGGMGVTVNVSGNDSDPQGNLDTSSVTLSFSAGGSCSLNPSSPNVEFVPDPGFFGLGSCGYTICDTSGNCSSATLRVTVNDAQNPTANNDSVQTNAGQTSVATDVSENDIDPENNMDLSSVTITATAAVGGSCAVTTSPLVAFTPSAGFFGAGSCEYQICDQASNCDTAIINVTVTDGTAPTVVNDSTSMNTSVANVSFDVLANDSDPENDLDASSLAVTTSTGGTCVAAQPNITFDPDPGFLGSASCGYRVCDSSNNCDTAVLSIAVTDGVAPTANNDTIITASGQTSQALDVSANDIDPENNINLSSVTVLAVPTPVGGVCSISGSSPLVEFAPNNGFSGTGSCTYQICDQANNCDTANISVTVSDSSAPTVLNDLGSMDTSSANVTVDVLANDSDPENDLDANSLAVTTSSGGACVAAQPNITFDPDPGFIGSASCGYTVCDGSNNCGNAVLTVTVTDGVAPTANNDSETVNSGQVSSAINVSENDIDPENNMDLTSVIITATPAVGGSCAVTTSPLVIFTPSAGFFGPGSCEYQICDQANNCDTAVINITVTDGTAPTVVNDSAAMDTSAANVSFDVLANDSDPQGDLDATSLTTTTSTGGTCSAAQPNIVFDPDPGFLGSASCGYRVCDGSNNCDTAVLSIVVTDGVAPTANNDDTTTTAGQPSSAINVSENDIDPENNMNLSSVTIQAMPAPVGGTCSVTTSPLVVFTPSANFFGAGSCTYQICDQANNCDTAVISVTVNDNTAPVVVNDSVSMNTSATNVSVDVLDNDSDPQGDLDAASLAVTTSTGGSCVAAQPNITFDPDPGFLGSASCGYTVCDGSNNCGSGVLSITVIDNVPPTANNDTMSTSSGQVSTAADVSANDIDPENNLDLSSVSILTMPSPVGGLCSISGSSPLVEFTPNAGFSGAGSCTYQICDQANNCSTATITINVSDNSAPVVLDDATSMNTSAANVSFDVLDNDSDPEGNLDPNSLAVSFGVGGTCLAAQPNITFTPSSGFTGPASCGYIVCDTSGNCSTATLSIDVSDGTAPIANDDSDQTNAGQASGFINVASNDLDPENQLDLSSVTILAAPASVGGTCTVSSSPFVVFTPTAGFSGVGSCTYQICDTSSNCASATVNVLVADQTPPVAVDDTATTNQNTAAAAVDVSANDSDPESNLQANSVSIVTGSEQNGSCAVSAPNITFTPDTDFAGIGRCDYQICDSSNNCSVAQLTVTVNDITQPTVTINQASTQSDPTNTLPIAFDITFSEPIETATFNANDINMSATTASGGVLSLVNAGDDRNFTLFVFGLTSNGNVVPTIPVNTVTDKNGQNNTASSSLDNAVAYDANAPDGNEINAFTWTLSSPVDGSISQDNTPQIDLSGAAAEDGASVQIFDDNVCLSAKGTAQTIASGDASFSDIAYLVDGSEDGEKIFYVKITDSVGNISECTPVGLDYTLDVTRPNVTVNQLVTQADPTGSEPIVFDVIFSEEIDAATFDSSDITQTGTAEGGSWLISNSVDSVNFTISYIGASADGTVVPIIAADIIEDIAGNLNTASSSTDNSVTYDLTNPTVNSTSTPAISLENDQAWPISGTCSEVGREVEVILEPGGFPGNIIPLSQPICQPGNTWSVEMDTRNISLEGEYTLQLTHIDAVGLEAVSTTAVYKVNVCNDPPGDIDDLVAANIAQQSLDLFWGVPTPGASPIADYQVEYRVPAVTSDWIRFPDGVDTNNSITVLSLNTSTEYELRVRALHSNGCASNYSNVVTALTKPNHPFFDSFDFELINLAGATQSRVAALEDSTVVYLFDDYTDYDDFTQNGNAGAVAQTISLEAGEIALIDPSFKGQILLSDNPIYATGEMSLGSGRGNPQWVPPLWADRNLLTNFVRSGSFPAVVEIYNFEEGADITLFEGSTVIDSASNVPADTIVTLTVPNDPSATVLVLNGISAVERSFKLESTGFVVAHGYLVTSSGNQVYDDMPFLPSSRKLLGVPSRAGFLGTSEAGNVNVTVYHSDGTIQTSIFDNSCVDTGNPLQMSAGNAISIMPFFEESCTNDSNEWRLFRPEVIYIEADGPIAGNNVADADGINAAPFVPLELIKRRYVIPHRLEYLVLASDRPAAINEINQAGVVVNTHVLSRTGDGPNNNGTFDAKVPYRIRFGTVERGTRFEGVGTSDVFVGWYQGIGDGSDPLGSQVGYERDDETVLYGYD